MTSINKDIWLQIQNGDEKAFEFIFRSYYSMLCSYAYDIIMDYDQAREIVQDVFVRIWENRSLIEINSSIKSYFFRSVNNQCINYLKHNAVLKRQNDNYQMEIIEKSDRISGYDEDYTLDSILYDGIEDDVIEAIDNLPDQCRQIFLQSRFERLSYEKIASQNNISINTVKTQLRRALEKIRTHMAEKISAHMKEDGHQ